MAVQQLQIPSSNINNLVDQSQWSTLGNLGNVYREAQAAQAKRAALANLGTDPQANMATLLQSGDPTLAQYGLNLQQKAIEQQREDVRYGVTDKRANAQLAIQQAAANRAQQDWLEQEADRKAAAGLTAGLLPGGAPPAAAAPFPAPLPAGASPQPTMPPQQMPPAGPPQAPPQAAVPPPVEPPPSAFGATPPVPAELQPPPVKAEGDETGVPSWASPQSLAGRMASNLASPSPTAAAGISREQLGALYANPLTRPLATAFLQKQLDPGTYSFQQVGDQLVRTNSKTGVSDVVMSDTKPTKLGEGERLIQGGKDVTPGGAPASKEEREAQGWFKAGKALNMTDDEARAYAANKGKTPKQDLSPTEEKAVLENTKQIHAGEDVIDNIHRLQELSKTAWSGYGAGTAATVAGAVLPAGLIPQGATDTTELQNVALQNVARQAKETFGARLAVAEVKLLNEIETNPLQSDAARQRIYTRLETMFQRHLKDMTSETEQIRNKTFFKPGGGGGVTTNPQPALKWSIEQ